MIFTETELQDAVHAIYEGATDTPGATEDDYLVRRVYLNMGIGFWEGWKGVNWNELYGLLADASDGDKTVATGDTTSDCPTDFVRTLGYIQLVDASGDATNYTNIDQDEAQIYIRSGSGANVYWITGGPGSYKINWISAIGATLNGYTIAYPYYKRASKVTGTTDIPQPSDHEFLVYYVLSWLYKEDNPGMARENLDVAISMILAMKQVNDAEKPYQDRGVYDKTASGFGR